MRFTFQHFYAMCKYNLTIFKLDYMYVSQLANCMYQNFTVIRNVNVEVDKQYKVTLLSFVK